MQYFNDCKKTNMLRLFNRMKTLKSIFQENNIQFNAKQVEEDLLISIQEPENGNTKQYIYNLQQNTLCQEEEKFHCEFATNCFSQNINLQKTNEVSELLNNIVELFQISLDLENRIQNLNKIKNTGNFLFTSLIFALFIKDIEISTQHESLNYLLQALGTSLSYLTANQINKRILNLVLNKSDQNCHITLK